MSRFAFALLLTTFLGLAASAQDKKKPPEPAPVVPKDGDKTELGRTVLAFDHGSHTRPIAALGFNKDQSKLITVGWDYSIQIWNTKSGERLDILRLPPYGRDNGADENRWTKAAFSSDGAFVAVGGAAKVFGDERQKTQLVVVDIANRRVRRVVMEPGALVNALAFSADGNRLAIGTTTSVYLLDDVKTAIAPTINEQALTANRLIGTFGKEIDELALSQSGDKLLVAERRGRLSVWNVSSKIPKVWTMTGEETKAGITAALAWSPDGSHFVRAFGYPNKGGLELRGIDGKPIKEWEFKDMGTTFYGHRAIVATLRYLAVDRIFISARGNITAGRGPEVTIGATFDPKTGKSTRRFTSDFHPSRYTSFGAASENGDLAATTSVRGLEVSIYRHTDGMLISQCGNRTPIPTVVGWASDPKAPAVAWNDDPLASPFKNATELKHAFDLTKMEPVPGLVPEAFAFRRLTIGEWSVNFNQGVKSFLKCQVAKNDKPFGPVLQLPTYALTLIPNGKDPPLIAYGRHAEEHMGAYGYLETADGKPVATWLPAVTQQRDMVPSPDGRYVLVSTGTHRLCIYRTDGSQFPFLNLIRANGEWVCCTTEGYYAASPGGEKMIGWSVHNGPNELATFHPATKFAKQFRRPDVIKLAIERGSVKEALVSLKSNPIEIEKILPPEPTLKLLKQTGAVVQVQARAVADANGKPVGSMRLLLDGRPLAEGRGYLAVQPGERAEMVWDVTLPPGQHELKLLARSEDSPAISAPLVLRAPKDASQLPTLYRICIGINEYDQPGLRLTAAAKDAQDLHSALAQYCVGPENHFGAIQGPIFLNAQATRAAVIAAFEKVRKDAKPGDLVVFFFAGHGVKQDNEYYLLTKEADPSKSLKDTSLSGADLVKNLSGMECPVLLLLDACHSAKAVKSLRPATDDLTRTLTDDTAGVTVMAAAMSHEVAMADAENGYFTAGLIKALKAGDGVPYDPYEMTMYTHHIYSVVFSEVRKATNGKQNPFLNMPWTVPPLSLRDIPKK